MCFSCLGLRGGMPLEFRIARISFTGLFCTYCARAHAEPWAGLADDDDILVTTRTPITVGQLRKLVERVADDVPLMGPCHSSPKTRSQCLDIVAARPSVTRRRLGWVRNSARPAAPYLATPVRFPQSRSTASSYATGPAASSRPGQSQPPLAGPGAAAGESFRITLFDPGILRV